MAQGGNFTAVPVLTLFRLSSRWVLLIRSGRTSLVVLAVVQSLFQVTNQVRRRPSFTQPTRGTAILAYLQQCSTILQRLISLPGISPRRLARFTIPIAFRVVSPSPLCAMERAIPYRRQAIFKRGAYLAIGFPRPCSTKAWSHTRKKSSLRPT